MKIKLNKHDNLFIKATLFEEDFKNKKDKKTVRTILEKLHDYNLKKIDCER
jgi:hypothetical protein